MRLHWSGLKARAEEKSVKVAARSAVVEAISVKEIKALAAVPRICQLKGMY